MFQTFISRHNSNFFSDKLVLTSVTPASSAPVLQTPKATSSTLYFDSLTVNAGNGGFLHCIQMDTSVNAANQVVSVGADIAFDADQIGRAVQQECRDRAGSPSSTDFSSLFLHDALPIFTSVTPASSAPVLQTPKATSSTLYFDSLTVNAGNGGFLHCIQMDTSVNAANQVVSVGADIAFDAD